MNIQRDTHVVGRTDKTTRGGNMWQGSRMGRSNEKQCYQSSDKMMDEHGTLQVATRED